MVIGVPTAYSALIQLLGLGTRRGVETFIEFNDRGFTKSGCRNPDGIGRRKPLVPQLNRTIEVSGDQGKVRVCRSRVANCYENCHNNWTKKDDGPGEAF